MEMTLLEARKRILYVKDADQFLPNCETFIRESQVRLKECAKDKNDILDIVADIYLDLQSFLTHWVLDGYIAEGVLSKGDIDTEVNHLYQIISSYGDAAYIASIDQEAVSIHNSQIKQICESERAGKLATIWGHDYCSGLSHSIRRGACFATSNPAKINLFRQDYPAIWAEMVDEIKTKHKGISMEKLISYLFMKTVAISMRDFYPIYEASDGRYGFVCIQVNPRNWEDSGKMIDEIDFWYKELQDELGTVNPNIVFKVPAVKAGLKVTEVLIAKNLRPCITLNFSVRQHEAFSDLIEKGSKLGFVVLMSGFLDDAVDKELTALGIAASSSYSHHAAEAVIRKSYANLRARGCNKTAILSAAIRGDWTIKNSLTDCTDSPMYFTTMTGKIEEFDSQPRSLTPMIKEPVPKEILEVLEKSAIFRQAYYPEHINLNNISTFIPLQNVLKAFLKAYDEIEASLK